MARRYFGTDGVRGVAGEFLTADLVERLGRAAVLWSGRERVFVGRDTRGSGPELEAALARGDRLGRRRRGPRRRAAERGGRAARGRLRPRRGHHRLAQPARVQRRQVLPARGQALRRRRGGDRGAPRRAAGDRRRGSIERDDGVAAAYVDFVTSTFGSDLAGLDVVLDCANGACSGIAVDAFERLGATVTRSGTRLTARTSTSAAARPTRRSCSGRSSRAGAALGLAFDGDGDRLIAVDEHGEVVDGDGILAILALDQHVDLVAVTQMTNLGFHALMRENGIRVVTTDVGDRYVLEALEREGGVLGGEQSGHIIHLATTSPATGLPAALHALHRAPRPHAQRGSSASPALHAVQGERPRRVEESSPGPCSEAVERATPSSATTGAFSSVRPARSRSFASSWRPETVRWRGRPVLPSHRLSRASSADSACRNRDRCDATEAVGFLRSLERSTTYVRDHRLRR